MIDKQERKIRKIAYKVTDNFTKDLIAASDTFDTLSEEEQKELSGLMKKWGREYAREQIKEIRS